MSPKEEDSSSNASPLSSLDDIAGSVDSKLTSDLATMTLAEDEQQETPQKATPQHGGKATIIGKWELEHCPCCRQSLHQAEHKINEPAQNGQQQQRQQLQMNSTNSLADLSDDSDDDDEEEELQGLHAAEDWDEDEHFLVPGVLQAGVSYTPTQILCQGWLHKKGTGKDWFKSRAWKPRWGRLVWAKVKGCGAIEVPLLLMFWYPSSTTASTAIVLSSTVVVAVDAPDPTVWNAHKFEVRHVGTGDHDDGKVTATRTFSAANRAERDAWVYAMAQALLAYAKSKQVHDNAVKGRGRPISPRSTPVELCRPISPPPPRPISPLSSASRPKSPLPTNLPKSPRSPCARKQMV